MYDRAIAIIGAIAAVLAIVIAFVLRERKHFDYEFISGTQLLANEANALGRRIGASLQE